MAGTRGAVEIVEVSPRDGIQNEPTILSTDDKRTLVERAQAAGLKRIEVTSFVNPRRVPQMADASALVARLPAGARHIGLVLNETGFERAVEAGIGEINFVVVASETFNARNQGASIADTLAQWSRIAARAAEIGLPAGITIAASFGCPFEGEVPLDRVLAIARRAAESRPIEIALADTIGCAVPTDVSERFSALAAALPGMSLRAHFHNTRNTGLANAVAAVEAGVRSLDTSIGGFGGCPFAPRATGNIPTEDLVYMLHRMGIETGLDIDALISAADWLGGLLGKEAPGLLHRAGSFPPARTPFAAAG